MQSIGCHQARQFVEKASRGKAELTLYAGNRNPREGDAGGIGNSADGTATELLESAKQLAVADIAAAGNVVDPLRTLDADANEGIDEGIDVNVVFGGLQIRMQCHRALT